MEGIKNKLASLGLAALSLATVSQARGQMVQCQFGQESSVKGSVTFDISKFRDPFYMDNWSREAPIGYKNPEGVITYSFPGSDGRVHTNTLKGLFIYFGSFSQGDTDLTAVSIGPLDINGDPFESFLLHKTVLKIYVGPSAPHMDVVSPTRIISVFSQNFQGEMALLNIKQPEEPQKGLSYADIYDRTPSIVLKPELSIEKGKDTVTVSWPAIVQGLVLQSGQIGTKEWTNLGAKKEDEKYKITLPSNQDLQMFRLVGNP